MMRSSIRPEVNVQGVIDRWPTTRAVFERYGIPTQTVSCPIWETIEQSAAARGHWATDALLDELNAVL